MHNITKTILSAILLLAASAAPAFAGTIEISDPVAHVDMHNDHGATIELLMNITNSGSAADRMYAARSKIAGEGRIAGGGSDNGGSHNDHMLATSIEVPAGGTTALNPSGSHIMLVDIKQTPQVGDEIKVTLFFEQAGRVNVTVTVAEEEH